jgi:hypothetical protein
MISGRDSRQQLENDTPWQDFDDPETVDSLLGFLRRAGLRFETEVTVLPCGTTLCRKQLKAVVNEILNNETWPLGIHCRAPRIIPGVTGKAVVGMVDRIREARAHKPTACVSAAQPDDAPVDLVTRAMIAAAAAVLEDQFECSPGTATIVAEDALRAAFQAENEQQQSASNGPLRRDIRQLPRLPLKSIRPLYPPQT